MPASTAYSNHELLAHKGELTIFGQLFLPGGYDGGQLPTIACAHGFGSNYLHAVPYAWELAAAGYAVYCFDFCGGGYASRSDGNPITMSLATEKDDCLAVMRMLSQRPEVDPNRLYLMGEGQGGFAATMAAHEAPELVRAMVLLYPAFYLHDEARRSFPTLKNIPVSYRQLGMRVGRCYGEVAWNTNPYTQMRDYPGHVLIVHGDEDATCPVEYSQRAAEVFPHARLEVIHGGKHVFRERALDRSISLVHEFLDQQVAEADKTEAQSAVTTQATAQAVASAQATPQNGAQSVAATQPATPFSTASTATASATSASVAASAAPASVLARSASAAPVVTTIATSTTAPTTTASKAATPTAGIEASKVGGFAAPTSSSVATPTTGTPSTDASSVDDEEVQVKGAHVAKTKATSTYGGRIYANQAQSIRGRHSVHKTRTNYSGGKHFRH